MWVLLVKIPDKKTQKQVLQTPFPLQTGNIKILICLKLLTLVL
jgi:hypothetical protein